MKLLFIRHGKAEPRDAGTVDAQRALAKSGRKNMARLARGLKVICPSLDVLASSRLLRAVQTAELIAAAYPGLKAVQVPELAPDSRPSALLQWLRQQPGNATIALAGHEPHLSLCIGWFLTERERSFIALKKGAACLLEFPGDPAAGAAVLHWCLQPAHLRALAAAS